MPHPRAVGIDLGTTFSAAAWIDPSGRTAMLRSLEGDVLTPSVVLFGRTEVAVGKEARNAAIANPELVVEWVKRDMGAPYYARPIHGQYLPPEVIQACILRKLKAEIQRALGPETACVITVPAYFDEPRRKATADAADMAGLKVLDIVNEPTAAALALGETLGYLAPDGAPKAEMTVLVYDLGGGTFDVTLLRLSAGNVETLATDGDVQLGGHDWDLRLVDYAAEQFQKACHVDPRHDASAMNRLLQQVIETKHALSARSRATLPVEYQGRTLEVQVTRELFAELTADLLERTAYTTRQLLSAAGVGWKDVSRLLLVGGSTRMPMVVEMLRQLSGMEPDRTVNPDEAVARGAALYAAYLLTRSGATGSPTAFEVSNVNSHSLGVEGIDPETMRKINVVLIPRNTRLPARRTEKFTTKTDNQRSIVVQVLEGESSLPGECTAIGRTVIYDLPAGMPRGWPVDVTFEYASNGRLSVRAVVPGTDHAAALDLERAVGLNHAGIARWREPIESAAGFDVFRHTATEVLGLRAMAGAPPPGQARAIPPAAATAHPGAMPSGTIPAGGFVSAPQPLGAAAPGPAEAAPPVAPADEAVGGEPHLVQANAANWVRPARRTRSWWWLVFGYVSSAVVGLGLGYLVLHLLRALRPDRFSVPW